MPCYITLHGDYLVAQCQRLLNHYAWCREQLIQLKALKGELNVDKKWQSDDLFYIIMNEIRHGVDQF